MAPSARRPLGPLTPTEFASAVTAITTAFGDPTRREIYLFAHERRRDGVTAAEVAERFELHPNVARHHLDKLAGGGYLEVAVERSRARRRRAGPSKRYRRRGERRRRSTCPSGTTTCSLTLLGRALALLPRRPGRGDGRGGRRRVRPGAWPPADGAATATASARSAPRSTRSPTRSPPTGSPPTPRARRRAAHRLRALPVRRRRHRAPGDLRRRPRHGQGHARRALRRDRARPPSRRCPWATTSASPRSRPGSRRGARPSGAQRPTRRSSGWPRPRRWRSALAGAMALASVREWRFSKALEERQHRRPATACRTAGPSRPAHEHLPA